MDGTRGSEPGLSDVGDLGALEAAVGRLNLTPGWIKRDVPILWREPHTAFVPAHWKYAEAKVAMDVAGRLIGTDLAERRNFVMRNPIPGNDIATARTLICAYQTILPGEKARSHRHAPHAFRVILDAHGAFSIVDGEKTPMETGDIVLTPGWCWHGHGHDGTRQAYWFDGLDVPLTHLLEPMFFEEHPAGFEPAARVASESPYRFPWTATQRALDRAAPDPAGHFGTRIALDAPSMPTMGLVLQRLESGARTRPFRTSANTIYVVMQGAGRSTIGGAAIDWSYGDTFVAPCWHRIEHRADADSVLFAMSDEPLMRFAKYYRFESL
ncbi:MAG TPA: cupin domain-containing protein [Alphaproteobacteria bacterium]|jgi:gentisate 1,2-dioxygenase|nr:cupin domain-containing protein [Alphaproteobacteria bacterium]